MIESNCGHQTQDLETYGYTQNTRVGDPRMPSGYTTGEPIGIFQLKTVYQYQYQ